VPCPKTRQREASSQRTGEEVERCAPKALAKQSQIWHVEPSFFIATPVGVPFGWQVHVAGAQTCPCWPQVVLHVFTSQAMPPVQECVLESQVWFGPQSLFCTH
jgi:hypothetical protein